MSKAGVLRAYLEISNPVISKLRHNWSPVKTLFSMGSSLLGRRFVLARATGKSWEERRSWEKSPGYRGISARGHIPSDSLYFKEQVTASRFK
ncbi:hypothetical protein THAOC_05957 [Thalassiosira oceanica]|uniref:Uncharacterized protein n=1 Tax=Thalassiosira oceanica TaxID=159749 RepID=K0T477_THAOC|nr:hypothetical protein THAOC_05957 [Thalassiosira oceanica]|eukprot:EJK72505.1 hypothetical protein THAOC_05957 [Thalassiosira oceanica]